MQNIAVWPYHWGHGTEFYGQFNQFILRNYHWLLPWILGKEILWFISVLHGIFSQENDIWCYCWKRHHRCMKCPDIIDCLLEFLGDINPYWCFPTFSKQTTTVLKSTVDCVHWDAYKVTPDKKTQKHQRKHSLKCVLKMIPVSLSDHTTNCLETLTLHQTSPFIILC